MFRITWISLLTGATGHSEAIFTEKDATDEVLHLNKTFPELVHSVEKYEPPNLKLNVKGHRCSYGDLTFVENTSPTPSQATTPSAYLTPKPSASQNHVQPLAQALAQPSAQALAQPSSVASLPSQGAQVYQQQSSPPPSDFSTSFF